MPTMKLTGFETALHTARTAARSGRPGAISTSAPAFSNACSRLMVSSRLGLPRPRVPAWAPLEVARAWKPSAARMRAEPPSHGLGITKAPGAWCSARNRAAFSLWLIGMTALLGWPGSIRGRNPATAPSLYARRAAGQPVCAAAIRAYLPGNRQAGPGRVLLLVPEEHTP